MRHVKEMFDVLLVVIKLLSLLYMLQVLTIVNYAKLQSNNPKPNSNPKISALVIINIQYLSV